MLPGISSVCTQRLLFVVAIMACMLPPLHAAGNDAPAPVVPDTWKLQDDSNFATDIPAIKKSLAPWYTAEFIDNKNSNDDHLGILLAAETGHQHYFRLSDRTPHAVRWELHIEMSWEGGFDRGWQFTEKGCYISAGEFRKPDEEQ